MDSRGHPEAPPHRAEGSLRISHDVAHELSAGSDQLVQVLQPDGPAVGGHESVQQPRLEARIIADVAQALRADEAAASWKKAGLSANELAELLFASSDGIKRIAKNPADYRKRLSVAVRLICEGCDG